MKQLYSKFRIRRAMSLLAALSFSLLAAAQDFTEDDVNYYVDGETAYVGGSQSATGDITVLAQISVDGKAYPVVRIGESAFQGSQITSVSIPDCVARIEQYAFNSCGELKTVSIGSGVTFIGYDAFYNASAVTDVYITANPETLVWEEGGCDDFMVSQGFTICHVSNAAAWTEKFAGEVNLVFRDATSVPISCTYDESSQTLTVSGTELMANYGNASLRPWHSYRDVATKLVIEEGVPNISSYAFQHFTHLADVSIPSTVRSIGYQALGYCYELSAINIPASVTTIAGASVFLYCSKLAAINVASDNPSYQSIDGVLYSKDGTELICCPGGKTSVNIPDGVTVIAGEAFAWNESISSVKLPDSLEEISYSAFSYCSGLTSIDIPKNVSYIGDSAFKGCSSLTSITIPDAVTGIGVEAFYGCI